MQPMIGMSDDQLLDAINAAVDQMETTVETHGEAAVYLGIYRQAKIDYQAARRVLNSR